MPTWETWSGEIRLPVNKILVPKNLDELIHMVQSLTAQSGDRVHAEGSRWAFSAPAYCEDVVISTDKLNGFPNALQDAINTPMAGGKFRVAVEAGIKVEALYNSLAGRPVQPRLPAPRNAPPPLPPDTWVLPVLGGAGGQSIAGAISTGTHGGDASRPPLSDAVLAMLMVGSSGELRLIQPKAGPVVDVARLSANLGKPVRDVRDDEMLNAAVVSLGRFGVIYAYVLEVINEGALRLLEHREKRSWFHLRNTLMDSPGSIGLISAAVANDEFLQVVFNPSRQRDGDHTCYLTTHKKTPFPGPLYPNVLAVRTADNLRPFMQALCSTHLTPELEVLRVALLAAIPLVAIPGVGLAAAALPPPLNLISLPLLPIATVELAYLLTFAAERLGNVSPGYLLGDAVADILNKAADLGLGVVGEIVTGALLDGEQKDWDVSGTRFEIADFFDYDHDCYRGDSIEVFFEVNNHLLNEIEQVLSVFDRLRDRGVPFGGYASLRFMARSQALLGLSRWPTTCSIEVAAIRGLRGNMQAMQAVQDIAKNNGGVVHWGQQNDLCADTVANSFGPSLTLWQHKLREMEGSSLLFSNPFTRAHGLEVPIEVLRGGDPWAPWEPLGLMSPDFGIGDAGAGQPLQVFARDTLSSLIIGRTRPIDGTPDSAWTPILPDPVVGRPVLKRGVSSGRLELFVLDLNLGRVKHAYEMGRPGGLFASWDTLGFLTSIPLANEPSVMAHVLSVAAHVDGRLEVFVQAARTEGSRMANAWAHWVDGPWSDVFWRGSESILCSPSACLRNFDSDQMTVVALGAGGKVLVIQQIGPGGDSGWTDWAEVSPAAGPRLVAAGQPIIVAVPGPGATVHILAMDHRGQLHETSDLRAALRLSWGPWQMLPSTSGFDFLDTTSRMATVVTDRLYVFARSQHGEVMEIEFQPGVGWQHWINLGGDTDADLTAGFHEGGRVEVVARGARDGILRARRQTAPGMW